MHVANQLKKRNIALVFLTCILAISIFAGLFVVVHADHEHNHNGVDGSCTICIQLHNTENLLRYLTTVFVAAVFSFFIHRSGVLSIEGMLFCVPASTPVALKIQMNN